MPETKDSFYCILTRKVTLVTGKTIFCLTFFIPQFARTKQLYPTQPYSDHATIGFDATEPKLDLIFKRIKRDINAGFRDECDQYIIVEGENKLGFFVPMSEYGNLFAREERIPIKNILLEDGTFYVWTAGRSQFGAYIPDFSNRSRDDLNIDVLIDGF